MFERWTKFGENPVVGSTHWGWTLSHDADGREVRYASADPSNIWKKDGKYYMVAGNLCLLNDNGRKPDSPEAMKGDCVYLFESSDLKSWTYRHPFYQRRVSETRSSGWTDPDEDNMCPSFLPLPDAHGAPSGKHLLLFISHNRGCQYYIGTYDKGADVFLPESHGRMTWVDRAYFAPEALIDGRGRQIAWVWLLDNPAQDFTVRGWSGVYGLPRSLWLREDGSLGIAPVDELQGLRMNGRSWGDVVLEPGQVRTLDGFPGDRCELSVECDSVSASRLALDVRSTLQGGTRTTIRYEAQSGHLVFDATRSGADGWRREERAPFALAAGESLRLRVFVDGPIVEVYANDRQAICRRVYPSEGKAATIVRVSAVGGRAELSSVKAWEISPTNAY